MSASWEEIGKVARALGHEVEVVGHEARCLCGWRGVGTDDHTTVEHAVGHLTEVTDAFAERSRPDTVATDVVGLSDAG